MMTKQQAALLNSIDKAYIRLYGWSAGGRIGALELSAIQRTTQRLRDAKSKWKSEPMINRLQDELNLQCMAIRNSLALRLRITRGGV